MSTGPIPIDDQRLALELNFLTGELIVRTQEQSQSTPIDGQSIKSLTDWVLARLSDHGASVEIDTEPFSAMTALALDLQISRDLWRIFATVDTVFTEFRGSLREETGPVHLWPHHFDLAVLWFSGRMVPGVDPDDEENADEQMNFGFVPGDTSIAEPYFYITAYPTPENFTDVQLPAGAYWHTEGFTGAILTYEQWLKQDKPRMALLNLLQTVHHAGKTAMLG